MSDGKRIDVPFEPEEHVGAWGWLWSTSPTRAGEWLLCRVLDDDFGTVMVRVFKTVVAPSAWYDVPGDELKGRPWLPMLRPNAEPGAGLEVAVRLPECCSLQMAWGEPGDNVDRAREAVIAAILSGEGAA